MYRKGTITTLHLELTTKCNANCIQCHRNMGGSDINPDLPLCELFLDDIRRILPPEFLRTLQSVKICGSYGDALVARDTLDIFQYLRAANADLRLDFHTNGSGRDSSWWQALAECGVIVTFAIDGLRDTNHLYRRGTSWDRIMDSVDSFVKHEGVAVWSFIAFEHNEHEIAEARQLCFALGFRRFLVKRTSRFFRDGVMRSSVPVRVRNGEELYTIAPPITPTLQHRGVMQMAALLGSGEELEQELAETVISCKALEEGSIYINSQGLMFPCCYLGAIYPRPGTTWNRDFVSLIKRLPTGAGMISLATNSIDDVLSCDLFTDIIPRSWEQGEQRLSTCAQTCGSIGIVGAEGVVYSAGENCSPDKSLL